MKNWKLRLDKDWQRNGFDASQCESDELDVSLDERFSAESILMAVLSAAGTMVLKEAAGPSVKAAVKKMASFAKSQSKKLKLELESNGFDPRVNCVSASIESDQETHFEEALSALPMLKAKADYLIRSEPRFIKTVWYVWLDGEWQLSYYEVEGGEFVEAEPLERFSSRSKAAPVTAKTPKGRKKPASEEAPKPARRPERRRPTRGRASWGGEGLAGHSRYLRQWSVALDFVEGSVA